MTASVEASSLRTRNIRWATGVLAAAAFLVAGVFMVLAAWRAFDIAAIKFHMEAFSVAERMCEREVGETARHRCVEGQLRKLDRSPWAAAAPDLVRAGLAAVIGAGLSMTVALSSRDPDRDG
ncbi:MAG TPA: hypothetical protein VMP42_08705 [Actinomycetota bacterium]|nr:hypothetical protein [Actinomycetota bacterium]